MSALDKLKTLLNRYTTQAGPVQEALWPAIKLAAEEVDSEMGFLEAQLITRRDWLDHNRNDERYAKRKAWFIENDVREHADYGDTLNRVKAIERNRRDRMAS